MPAAGAGGALDAPPPRPCTSRVVFGVRRAAPERPPEYHAWLVMDGETVIGGRRAGSFTPLPASRPANCRRTPSAVNARDRQRSRTSDGATSRGPGPSTAARSSPAPCSPTRRAGRRWRRGCCWPRQSPRTFGIALLIPLLYAAGLDSGPDQAESPVRDALARAAETLGVELTLPLLLGAFLVLVGVRSLAAWQRELQLTALRLGFVDGLRKRLYAAAAHAAWPFLVRRRSSDLLHLLTQDDGPRRPGRHPS